MLLLRLSIDYCCIYVRLLHIVLTFTFSSFNMFMDVFFLDLESGIVMNDRIKALRKHFALTQQEFADRLHVKRGAIANYEIGRNIPTDSVVSLICREFGVSEEWLRTGCGDMFIELSRREQLDAFFNDVKDDEFKSRFVSMLAGLNPDEWDALEKVVLAMKEKLDMAASADPEDDDLSDQSVDDLEDQYKISN